MEKERKGENLNRWTLASIAILKDNVGILDEISGEPQKMIIQLEAMKRTIDNTIEFLIRRGREVKG